MTTIFAVSAGIAEHPGSHAIYVSDPETVAKFIETAAGAVNVAR